MPYYINGSILDFRTLRNDRGEFVALDSSDDIKKIICNAWYELEKRFWSKGEVVEFRTPGIMSGGGPGNRGYWYPRSLNVKTKKGNVHVAWADEVKSDDGRITYSPVSRNIGVNEKTLNLGPDDVEEAIFMFAFNPMVVSSKNPSGMTFLVDKEEDARKYEESESKNAIIAYWLYRKESPMYDDEQSVYQLCLAYGLNPENKSMTLMKQMLSTAIKSAEAAKNAEMGYAGFNTLCERMKDGNDTKIIEIAALIQKCVLMHIIKMNWEKSQWEFLGDQGQSLKTICKVLPVQQGEYRKVLRQHLESHLDDLDTLRAAAGGDPLPNKRDRILLSLAMPSPEEITEDWIENVLPWPDKKKLYAHIGHDNTSATKDKVNPILVEYFVVQKKTVNYEVKRQS